LFHRQNHVAAEGLGVISKLFNPDSAIGFGRISQSFQQSVVLTDIYVRPCEPQDSLLQNPMCVCPKPLRNPPTLIAAFGLNKPSASPSRPVSSGEIPHIGPPDEALFAPVTENPALPDLFFDTSVISAIVSRGARHQAAEMVRLSRVLWDRRGNLFNPVISALIVTEIERPQSEPEAVNRRKRLIHRIKPLAVSDEVFDFAERLSDAGAFRRNPDRARSPGYDYGDIPNDAYHVAVATVFAIPLLTSFDRDFLNEAVCEKIESVCIKTGFPVPLIFSPANTEVFKLLSTTNPAKHQK
jgi:predicted nucleic acid-binding protein